MKTFDMIGVTSGNLTVIKKSEVKLYPGRGGVLWVCQCKCGNYALVPTNALKSGLRISCGCKRGGKKFSNRRIGSIWRGIILRCNDPKYRRYEDYGGRGISVCAEWLDGEVFSKWAIENGYKDNLSIDRINNDGNYEPKNCRWTTNKVQSSNRRSTRYVKFNGKRQTYSQWETELKMNTGTIGGRIRRGWSVSEALTTPTDRKLYGYVRTRNHSLKATIIE